MAKKRKWTKKEARCGKWFQDNMDSSAVVYGGSNAFKPDIVSPKYGIGEVKVLPAQGGQFTKSTIDINKYSRNIAAKRREDVTIEESTQWTKEHYRLKGVTFFVVMDKNKISYYTFDDFFEQYCSELEDRTTKGSGSRELPKFARKFVPADWNIIIENKRAYVTNPQAYDQRIVYMNTKKEPDTMWVSPETGEIRTLSKTKNETWIFQILKRE